MSKNSSVQRLPVEVDPYRLVEQGRIYEGRIPQSDFPRLKEQLFNDNKSDQTRPTDKDTGDNLIQVKLEFTRTKTNLPVIVGNINAALEMPCQRCLQSETVPLETSFEVVLVSSDAEAQRLQEGYDTWLVEDQRLFIQDFIEDEILLALPFVVSHKTCEPAKALIEASPDNIIIDGDAQTDETQEKENPFAVLKDLKLN